MNPMKLFKKKGPYEVHGDGKVLAKDLTEAQARKMWEEVCEDYSSHSYGPRYASRYFANGFGYKSLSGVTAGMLMTDGVPLNNKVDPNREM